MAGVIQKPDSLSLSGNLRKFILTGNQPVSFVLKKGDTVLLESEYIPGADNLLDIDVKDVVESCLSYNINASTDAYVQSDLVANFTAKIGDTDYPFRVIRGGVSNLADTAANWLKLHFLTWQPRVKEITYYSPEWLTYYAVDACAIKLKATYPDKTSRVITLHSCSGGTAVTLNVQYSAVAGRLGNTYPSFYEVWTETSGGTKLSESQVYAFSDVLSEDEQWYLFENSLGGLDTFRAYGTNNLTAEHGHNVAEFGDVREEYQVDTDRKYTKNTGYLDEYARRWMLDFFPSRAKYVYDATAIRKIVVTESNVTYISSDLPSSYTFTWQMAEVSALLNLVKNESDIPGNLVAPDLSSPDFILPPRLAEFPRVQLTEGVLIPAFDPHNPKPTVTTYGAIHNTIKNAIVKELEDELAGIGSGGSGGGDCTLEIIESFKLGLIPPTDKNVYSALSTDLRITEEMNDFLVDINGMYLRKDIDDVAYGVIAFDKKIGSTVFIDGWEGKGWEMLETGAGLFDSARVRSDVFLGNKFGSPSYASGFTGWGVEIDIPTATAEMDNLFIRKTFTAYEIVYSQIYGLGGSQIVSDLNKIAHVEVLPDRFRCYMDDMDGLMLMNLRKGDGVRIQTRTGTTSIKYLMGRCIGVDSEYFDIAIPLLEGTGQPETGDFATRWGNNEDVNRQGLIYLTTADSGAPFIDVYDGITGTSTEGKLKARLGKLSGIRTLQGDQLAGYGAYLNGVYIENSTFYTDTGETVDQRFVAMNGKFDSTIAGIKNDMSLETGNILRNSSFGSNTNYWTSAVTVNLINVAGSYLWVDGSFYVEKLTVADIYNDHGRNVLRVRNATISQINAVMNIPSRSETSEDGYAYSFSFYAKVVRPGTLTAGVDGTDLYIEQQLAASEGYQKISKFGKWNEKGDFKIQFTGEILIYGVSLFNDALADAQIKLQTQILQTKDMILLKADKDYVDAETGQIYVHYDSQLKVTAEQISAISTKVDNVNNTIETAGWVTTAQGNTLFAAKTLENGQKIISYINQTPGNTTIASNRINLIGAVSYSMFDVSMRDTINGKADSSALGDLAYQDYVYSRDLAYDITDVITKKVSPDQLRNYAFANGALISKSDFINALQTEINAKMIGSSTTSGNKLASVIINGQTLVLGGYIQTNLINVDELWCTSLKAIRGKIAGFTIEGNNLTNTDFNSYIYIQNPGASKFVKIGGTGSEIVSIQSYGQNNIGLYIISNNPTGDATNYAIQSFGRHIFGQRASESWNAPGVLCTYLITPGGARSKIWGEGCVINSVTDQGNGKYTINHNLPHTSYSVQGTIIDDSNKGFMKIYSKSNNSCVVEWHNFNGSAMRPTFEIQITGRNKW